MEHAEILHLFDRQQRIDVIFNDSIREEEQGVVRHLPRFGNVGFVLYAALSNQDADDKIAAQIRYFTRLGYHFEWKLYSHDQPADLGSRLVDHGFVLDDRESVMVLDLAAEPGLLRERTSLDIRRIEEPRLTSHVAAVEAAVWQRPFDSLETRLAHDLREAADQVSVYVAYADEIPVAAAWMYLHPGTEFASHWGGSTLPAYRRRGYYTALLAARVQHAAACGARLLTVDAGDMSRPVLEKRGFIHLTDTLAYRYQLPPESGLEEL